MTETPKPKGARFRNVFWAGYKNTVHPWGVRIHVRKAPTGETFVNLGYFADEEEAARVADAGLVLIHFLLTGGEDLRQLPEAKDRLNFDGEPPDSVPAASIWDEIQRKLGVHADYR